MRQFWRLMLRNPGGLISPGNNGIGTLIFNNNLTLNAFDAEYAKLLADLGIK